MKEKITMKILTIISIATSLIKDLIFTASPIRDVISPNLHRVKKTLRQMEQMFVVSQNQFGIDQLPRFHNKNTLFRTDVGLQ